MPRHDPTPSGSASGSGLAAAGRVADANPQVRATFQWFWTRLRRVVLPVVLTNTPPGGTGNRVFPQVTATFQWFRQWFSSGSSNPNGSCEMSGSRFPPLFEEGTTQRDPRPHNAYPRLPNQETPMPERATPRPTPSINNHDTALIQRALQTIPANCRYHGDKLERENNRPCCDTGLPSLYRRQAEAALKRARGEQP